MLQYYMDSITFGSIHLVVLNWVVLHLVVLHFVVLHLAVLGHNVKY